MTWERGRQLKSVATGGTTYTYAYDSTGIRTGKVGGNLNAQYILNGTQVTRQIINSNIVDYIYHETGAPLAFVIYNPSNYTYSYYFYETNIFGDIVGICDENGQRIISFTYDAWGNFTTQWSYYPESSDIFLEAILYRYRGYIYDTETGFYYLQSRYYDPQICRFINSDNQISGVGGDILGYNLFAYCFNNPVNMSDSSGHWPKWFEDATIQALSLIIEISINVVQDCINYNSDNESESVVFESNYFSNYKGALVIKTPFDTSFSFGFIGLSIYQEDSNTLRHEYGHFRQFKIYGLWSYTVDVAIPSIIINMLDRQNKLIYDYYSYPWEAEADELGETSSPKSNLPSLPQGEYTSYWDLIKLFF